MYRQHLQRVFMSWTGIRNFGLFFISILIGLFLFSERVLLFSVLRGEFPVGLFLDIFPAVLYGFLFPDYFEHVIFHYLLLATLFGIYITLLVDLFSHGKFISLSSLSVGLASLFGISLGLTCLSCSILGGYLVLSVVTALSTVGFVAADGFFFLILGELLLVISIVILLAGVARISRKR